MQPLNLSGTKTGRFSSAQPNYSAQPRDKSFFDISYYRPKGTPIRSSLIGGSLLSSNIHNILNLDYKKLEQRVWGSYYFPPSSPSYEVKLPESKNIYVMNRPVEITALETFRVEIAFPGEPGILAWEQDKKCLCTTRTLMREGCQCGGV